MNTPSADPSPAAPSPAAPLADWLAYIEGIHPVGIELGLERVRGVADRLQLLQGGKLNCPVITVAGTNGKGSTCATLEGIYAAAGYKTGLYTSPHLVHFEERCRIRGQSVAAADLAAALRAGRAAFLAAGGLASAADPDGSPAAAVAALRGRRAGAFLAAGLSPVDAAEIAGAAGVAGGAALMGSGATVGAGAAGAVAAPLAPCWDA